MTTGVSIIMVRWNSTYTFSTHSSVLAIWANQTHFQAKRSQSAIERLWIGILLWENWKITPGFFMLPYVTVTFEHIYDLGNYKFLSSPDGHYYCQKIYLPFGFSKYTSQNHIDKHSFGETLSNSYYSYIFFNFRY